MQKCCRIGECDWGWWRVSLQVGLGIAGSSGRLRTLGSNGHYPRILDVGNDWDSSELWTAHFSLAFSNIINSSSPVHKILSVHTVKDGVLKDGMVYTGRYMFSPSGVNSCLRPTRAGQPLEDGNSRLGPGQGSTFEHFTRIAGL